MKYSTLENLYDTDLRTNQKPSKQQTSRLREEYQSLKTSLGGYAGYDVGRQELNIRFGIDAIYTESCPHFEIIQQ